MIKKKRGCTIYPVLFSLRNLRRPRPLRPLWHPRRLLPNFCKYLFCYYKFAYYYFNFSPGCYSASSSSSSSSSLSSSSCSLLPEPLYLTLSNGSCVCLCHNVDPGLSNWCWTELCCPLRDVIDSVCLNWTCLLSCFFGTFNWMWYPRQCYNIKVRKVKDQGEIC